VSLVLAMHQPNYLPWLGTFDKMRRAGVFVLLDTVQYPRGRSVANRNRIRTPNGELLLTVPVVVPRGRKGKALYTEVAFADDRWREKHLRSIEQAYRRAPYFEAHFTQLAEIVTAASSFCELNVALIKWLAQELGIETRTVRLSELDGVHGQKNELTIGVCRALGATVYLSGAGARSYNDPAALAAAGIELRYQDFVHPVYPQLGEGFVPNLSAVDLLFNCGRWPEGAGG
jgi:hypothetical protein